MSGGSGDVCLRKAHHEPSPFFAKDADLQVEAYGWHRASCAAGLDNCYEPWPIHSRTLTEDNWTFPFMALHNAYLLEQQCQHLNELQQVEAMSLLPKPLISCFRQPRPTTELSVERAHGRAVNFSPSVDLHLFNEDEIVDSGSLALSHDDLQDWPGKPWRKRRASVRPRQCRATDEHDRTAAERFQDDFHRPPQAGTHNVLLDNQPAFIQDLAVAVHQADGFDPHDPGRTHELLIWYLNGRDGRVCRHPRSIIVTEDIATWYEDIITAWHDRILRQAAVHFLECDDGWFQRYCTSLSICGDGNAKA